MFTFLYSENQGQNEGGSNLYLFIHKFIQFLFPFTRCICFSIGLTTCYFLAPIHNYTLCILEGQLCPQDRPEIHQKIKAYNYGSSFTMEEYESKEKVDGETIFLESSSISGKPLTVIAFPRVYSFAMTRVDPYQKARAYDAYISRKAMPMEMFAEMAFLIPIFLAFSRCFWYLPEMRGKHYNK